MSTEKPGTYLDPVVDRVREARRELAEAYDFDVDRMADLFQHMQAEHPERVAAPKRFVGSGEEIEPTTSAKP